MSWSQGVRHPIAWLHETTGDGPVAALLILFGINAVDELARVAIAVSGPTIADSFGVGVNGVAIPFVLAFSAALGLAVPIATFADRGNRVRLAVLGGIVFSIFSVCVGLAWTVWVLAIAMAGMQVGKAFIEPSHTSLLSDYYPVDRRPRVFSFYRGANALGALVGAITAGYVAEALGWRAPFFAFALPMLILVALGSRLPEPRRGLQEQRQGGAEREALALEEAPPSLAEAWRMCWQVDSLRRIYRTLPFLTPALIGFALYGSFAYRDIFGLDTAARGWVIGLVEGPSQLFGLIIGTRLAMRAFSDGPAKVFHQLARALLVVSVAAAVFAAAPVTAVAIGANVVVSAGLAFVVPGLFATLSLVLPPRARSTGFALASVFVLAGLLTFPVVGLIANSFGMRWGIAVLAPVLFIGGLVVGSAGDLVTRDIMQVWAAAATRTQALAAKAEGRSTLLLVQGLDVFYGDVQVLAGVGIEAREGEIVALLGTNGAGKSTLLQAIAGLVPASKGAVILDGRDITYAPAHEVASRGVALVPGGWATFPSLTVADNLRAAGWVHRRDRREAAARVEEVLAMFPPLREVLAEPAANLSGGQQHMLGLSMALLARPKLLLIDELSLGLAPVVVDKLVEAVRDLARSGTTVVVVEQSLDVALTLAERAYFLDKGRVRFEGPTADLRDRPDLLRSTFLAQAAAPARTGAADGNGDSGEDGAPALELVAVSRSFGGIKAVDEVSLCVARGEVVGIIGPNGAGKSTLVDIASGFTPSDGGSVRLHGREVSHLSANGRARRGLGRSFQAGRLFPGLTVDTCLAVAVDRWGEVTDPVQHALHLPAAYDEERRVARRVDELVDLLALGAYRDKFVHELSTGTRRVVELACVMALRPTVVLLDEPASGLAQREVEALAPLLVRLRDRLGASLVVVEHDMPLVTAVSDRLVALDLGRVVAEGPPDEVLSHPEVVASYLGTRGDPLCSP
ncbi:MAG TPA: MFS transporter [Acidimicrobiales bacterium]